MKKLILLPLMLIVLSTLFADEMQIDWQRTFSFGYTDLLYDVVTTSDGNFVMVGDTGNSNANINDVSLIKMDSEGNEIWRDAYSSPGNWWDTPSAVCQTSDGGYAVCGYTGGFEPESVDKFFLLKVNENGTEEWMKYYTFQETGVPGESSARAFDMKETSDGGFIMVGLTILLETGYDFFAVRTDSNGNEIWHNTYDFDGGSDTGIKVLETADNGYFIAGVSENSWGEAGDGTFEAILKLDSLGNQEWQRILSDINEYYRITDLIFSEDGKYILVGRYYNFSENLWNAFIQKVDLSGNIVWTTRFASPYSSYFNSVTLMADRSFIAVGRTYESDDYAHFYAAKVDSHGSLEFDRIWNYGISNNELIASSSIDGTSLLVGGLAGTDIYFNDLIDFYIAKLDMASTSVDNTMLDLKNNLNNYPNPFNPETTIYFSNKEAGYVNLTIYNVKGQIVKTLINTVMKADSHSIVWDGTNNNNQKVSSGIYFYKLRTKTDNSFKKMILMK